MLLFIKETDLFNYQHFNNNVLTQQVFINVYYQGLLLTFNIYHVDIGCCCCEAGCRPCLELEVVRACASLTVSLRKNERIINLCSLHCTVREELYSNKLSFLIDNDF